MSNLPNRHVALVIDVIGKFGMAKLVLYMPRQYPKWPSIAAVGGQKLAEESPVTWFEHV